MSQANYIIICEYKINVLIAKTVPGKLQALSSGAAALVSHIDLQHPGKLTNEDTKPISELQHYIMDNLLTMKAKEAKEKIEEMFTLWNVLEDKFEA